MKEHEVATAEKIENWSNLSPELDAAVDRAHAQVAAGQYHTEIEFLAHLKAKAEERDRQKALHNAA